MHYFTLCFSERSLEDGVRVQQLSKSKLSTKLFCVLFSLVTVVTTTHSSPSVLSLAVTSLTTVAAAILWIHQLSDRIMAHRWYGRLIICQEVICSSYRLWYSTPSELAMAQLLMYVIYLQINIWTVHLLLIPIQYRLLALGISVFSVTLSRARSLFDLQTELTMYVHHWPSGYA